MGNRSAIDPQRFVSVLQPLIQKQDARGLISTINEHWALPQVVCMLESSSCDARKIAALALSLVGTSSCIDDVAKQLHHPDEMMNQMAEHALWSIWFRGGTDAANAELARGARAMARKDFAAAIACFTRAIEFDDHFAEAYNQRGLAHYLLEEYAQSVEDCKQCVELMPCHFGAWAGIGHCRAHQGEVGGAIKAYKSALKINPKLDCVSELIKELQGQ